MAYIGTSPSQGVRHRYLFTATSGQTTFSGADDDSRTLSYTDTKFMDVFLNGVLLDPNSDYTATNGTSVVLTSGASAGDLLEVIAFDSFSVFSGTFGGDVTVSGDLTVNQDVIAERVIIGDNTVTPAIDAGDLVVGGSTGNNGITIGTATTGLGSLRFADTGGTGRGIVLYDHSSDYMSFHAAGGERLRILSTGGITFNGDTSTANALDDYEEGTWTPTDITGGLTLTIATGHYIKIGQFLYVWYQVQYPSNSDTNPSTIGGLPFAASGTQTFSGSISITNYGNSNILGMFEPSVRYIKFRDYSNGNITNANLSGKFVYGTAAYITT